MLYAYVFYPCFYVLLINYLLCAPAQSHIHQGLGIFLTFSTLDFYLNTLYLDDFKTQRTAKHMAYFMIRVFNTVYYV